MTVLEPIGELVLALNRASVVVDTPMGVGGWQSTLAGPGMPIPSRRYPGVVLDCREDCCRRWAPKVRRMVRVYGAAFFSDGMGV